MHGYNYVQACVCKCVCVGSVVCIVYTVVHVVSYDIIMNLIELGYLYIGIQIVDVSYSYAYVKYIFDLTVYHGFCYKLSGVRTGS